MTLLQINQLNVRFGAVDAVQAMSLSVAAGETAAIVGETGSGKSVSMLAALSLLPRNAMVTGSVTFDGRDLLALPRSALDKIRGKSLSIVFQEPQSALDPLFTIGAQIAAILRHGAGLDRRAAWQRAVDLLDEVGLSDPARRAGTYPHELSGGQRQRVAIAMAIACQPKLLIADEPTTALDVTVAARILALLAELKARHGMALLLISHDLGLVRRVADTIHVMEKGHVIETGPAAQITTAPTQDYTKKLLAADRLQPAPAASEPAEPLLTAHKINVHYALRHRPFGPRRVLVAVDHVSLDIGRGETLGLIGESGSGKSTLGRALLRLLPCTGTITFAGGDLMAMSADALRPLRRDLQIVFQDPFASLSPRWNVGDIVGEGLTIHEPGLNANERAQRVAAILDEVGLPSTFMARFPHELSGGQRQRVAVARAMILSPRLVVLDEPTSALDRSVQADVLDLLRRLQRERGLSYLFITHDLAVVRAMAARVAVMKDGRIIETGPTAEVMAAPREDYTKALLAAAFGSNSSGSTLLAPAETGGL